MQTILFVQIETGWKVRKWWHKVSFSIKFVRVRVFRERGIITKVIMMTLFIGIIVSMVSFKWEVTNGPQRYLKTLSVDYWITQKGADSLSNSSFVNPQLMDQLHANGYTADGTLVYFNKVNDRQGIYQSYQPRIGILNPKLEAGRQVSNAHEVVLDHVMASHLGAGIGDTVQLTSGKFKVVGLSSETNSVGKETAFISDTAMFNLVGNRAYQAIAVKLRPHQSWPPAGIDLSSYKVATNEEFLASNLSYQQDTFTPFFNLIIAIAAIGLSLVMTLALKREINDRVQELGILKAVGATGSQLVINELGVMIVIGTVGTFLGYGLAWLLVEAVNSLVPGASASASWSDVLVGWVVAMLVTAVAITSSFWRLRKLSAVEAIRTA